MNVSIIIPAHNEERAIGATLRGLVTGVGTSCEIIVVADHCTDHTEELVESTKTSYPIHLMRNTRGKGFGNALITGFEQAQGTAVVPVMADTCDDPRTIEQMYRALEREHADVVCASRYMEDGKKIGGPWLQDKLSRLVCFSLRLFTGIPTSDAANSFKMYRRTFLKMIGFEIESAGTEYSMALLFRAYRAGGKIIEIPTTWRGKTMSASKELYILRRFPGYWKRIREALSSKMIDRSTHKK